VANRRPHPRRRLALCLCPGVHGGGRRRWQAAGDGRHKGRDLPLHHPRQVRQPAGRRPLRPHRLVHLRRRRLPRHARVQQHRLHARAPLPPAQLPAYRLRHARPRQPLPLQMHHAPAQPRLRRHCVGGHDPRGALRQRHRRQEPVGPGVVHRRDVLRAGLPVSGAAGGGRRSRGARALGPLVPRSGRAHARRPNSFALCLPSGPGNGVAIFGGGPLIAANGRPLTEMLVGETPLRKHKESPGYYISASKGIAVDGAQVPVGQYAPLTIGLSTTIPYAELRRDVYRPLINAFDQAMERQGGRVPSPAAAPFELWYNSSRLSPTRFGYFVPTVDLMLEGGRNWTVFGINSMAQVNRATACFAFVEMKTGDKSDLAPPAVVLGGFQMQQNLLVFDEEKQTLGFTSQLTGRGLSCGQFNFTM
ncbi:LOW QUALITY PROTEIN: hypothetical protein CFC21_038017, partial [Triticum aestivum]